MSATTHARGPDTPTAARSGRPVLRAPTRPVSRPGDRHEREADRVAAEVAAGRSVVGWTPAAVPLRAVSRQEPQSRPLVEDLRPRTQEQEYDEATSALVKALPDTELGRRLQLRLRETPLVEAAEAFAGTLPGKVVIGSLAAGAVGTLAATGRPLPLQLPALPLRYVHPALENMSLKLTWEGPVAAPTRAFATFTWRFGGPGGQRRPSGPERPPASSRPGPLLPQARSSAAEDARMARYLASRLGRLPAQDYTPPTFPALSGGAAAPGGRLAPSPFRPEPIRLLEEELQLKPLDQVPEALAPRREEETAAPVNRSTCQDCGPDTAATSAAPASVDAAVAAPGRPLEPAVRRSMEARFGHDFSTVRVRSDAASTRAVDAEAYTVGDQVVFAPGRYEPSTSRGTRLLAHELAHVVQGGTAVRRQAATPAPAPAPAPAAPAPAPAPAKPQREERLNLGRGGHRVDAELDRGIRWLTVRMKVRFRFHDSPQRWPSAAHKTSWRQKFIAAVTKRWSFKHLLVPAQPTEEPSPVSVRVQVVPVTAGQHFTMNVGYTTSFRTSSVGGRTATMDALDVSRRSDTPQVPAEHEFGHMLGLPHIRCARNDEDCYGVLREEKADILGSGSYVSPRDYEPFAELMPYFSGVNWRVQQGTRLPTDRAPQVGAAVGGILGGLLGAAGGAGLGFLLGGPIGAIVGGILGAVGGAVGGGFLGRFIGRRAGVPEVP